MRRYADVGAVIVEALTRFVGDVRGGAFPSDEESYHVAADVVAAVQARRAPLDPPPSTDLP